MEHSPNVAQAAETIPLKPAVPLVKITVAALLLLLIILAHRYGRSADEAITLSSPCNLQQGECRQTLPFGTLTLRLSPLPIPLMQPIYIELQSEGFRAESLEINFAGAEMDMGLNRRLAEFDAAHSTPSIFRYHAETVLPVCVSGQMRWKATVRVQRPENDAPINIQWTFLSPR